MSEASSTLSYPGCQEFGPVHRGIYLANVTRSRVTDCTIVDRRPAATILEAIRMLGPGSGNLIANNLVSRGTSGDVVVEPGNADVRGNTVA